MRYALILSYNGAKYHGWQSQPNAVSVQDTTEHALSTLLRQAVAVTGAGRTDTGVHAEFFVAHFDVKSSISDTEKFLYRLNRFLPQDIAIQRIIQVSDDFHARFSASSRTYEYRVHLEKNPFLHERSMLLVGNFDFEKMNEAAQILFDYEDFTSFSKLHTDVKTNNCKIMQADWTLRGTQYVFTIQADRFLRNMVRAVVGTLLEVGQGKVSLLDFREIIEQKNRSSAGASVPGYALYLTDIAYPEEI